VAPSGLFTRWDFFLIEKGRSVAIDVLCPRCKQTLRFETKAAGHVVPCPTCGLPCRVPAEPSNVRRLNACVAKVWHESEDNRAELAKFLKRLRWDWIATILCGIAFLSTIGTARNGSIFMLYASLSGLAAGIAILCCRWLRIRSRRRVAVAGLAILLAWRVWKYFDFYQEHWTSPADVQFVDKYLRWGHQITQREIRWPTPPGLKFSLLRPSASGPMAGNTKPHGEWTYISWDPFESRKSWYWYGESISEGEWHLRKK